MTDRLIAHRHQAMWDEAIIKAWKSDKSIQSAVMDWNLYFGYMGPFDKWSREDWHSAWERVSKLKRVPPKERQFKAYPARVFFSDYLRPVSEMLWNRFDMDEALREIKKTEATSFFEGSVRLNKPRSKQGVRLFVETRARDKRYEWGTVK